MAIQGLNRCLIEECSHDMVCVMKEIVVFAKEDQSVMVIGHNWFREISTNLIRLCSCSDLYSWSSCYLDIPVFAWILVFLVVN